MYQFRVELREIRTDGEPSKVETLLFDYHFVIQSFVDDTWVAAFENLRARCDAINPAVAIVPSGSSEMNPPGMFSPDSPGIVTPRDAFGASSRLPKHDKKEK